GSVWSALRSERSTAAATAAVPVRAGALVFAFEALGSAAALGAFASALLGGALAASAAALVALASSGAALDAFAAEALVAVPLGGAWRTACLALGASVLGA